MRRGAVGVVRAADLPGRGGALAQPRRQEPRDAGRLCARPGPRVAVLRVQAAHGAPGAAERGAQSVGGAGEGEGGGVSVFDAERGQYVPAPDMMCCCWWRADAGLVKICLRARAIRLSTCGCCTGRCSTSSAPTTAATGRSAATTKTPSARRSRPHRPT